MAEWSKNKVDASLINGGKEFTTDDDLAVAELNAIVNNSFYSADKSDEAKNVADASNKTAQEAKEIAQEARDYVTEGVGTSVTVGGVPQISWSADFVEEEKEKSVDNPIVHRNEISNPNLLINGRFTVNQRAIDTKTVDSVQYTVDRWMLWLDSGSATVSTGLSGVTVNNSSNTSRVIFRQYLEDGIMSQIRGQKITCSVYMNRTIYSFTTTVPISDVYAVRTIGSVSLPIGEFRFVETPNAYAVDVYINAGSIAYINYVKMETGENVTPMSITPYGEELAKCQRYFIRLRGSGNYNQFASGFMYSASKAFNLVPLPASLRTKPTITHSGNLALLSVGGYSAFTSLSVDTLSSNLITLTCSGTFTAGNPCFVCSQADASAYIDLDAEIY